MNATDLKNQDMAHRMQLTASQVSRMIHGFRSGAPTELAVWLAICGIAHGADREIILAWCEQEEPHVVRLQGPQRWISLHEHIDQTREVHDVAPAIVPWALQTSAYTHALTDTLSVNADTTAVWGDVLDRLFRQTLNTTRPTRGWSVLLHEQVLRTVVGDRQVMGAQLCALLQWSKR